MTKVHYLCRCGLVADRFEGAFRDHRCPRCRRRMRNLGAIAPLSEGNRKANQRPYLGQNY